MSISRYALKHLSNSNKMSCRLALDQNGTPSSEDHAFFLCNALIPDRCGTPKSLEPWPRPLTITPKHQAIWCSRNYTHQCSAAVMVSIKTTLSSPHSGLKVIGQQWRGHQWMLRVRSESREAVSYAGFTTAKDMWSEAWCIWDFTTALNAKKSITRRGTIHFRNAYYVQLLLAKRRKSQLCRDPFDI